MLRSLIGFDHCIKNVADSWFATSGITIQKYPGEVGKSVIVNDKGGLTTVSGSTSGTRTIVSMKVSPEVPVANTYFVLAFRITIENPAGLSGPIAYVAGDVAGTSAQTFPTFAQIFPGGVVAGASAHIEIYCDTANKGFGVYANGTFVSGGTNDPGSYPAMATGVVWFFPMLANASASGAASFRDIVFMDSVAGDGFTSRQGDRVLIPITVDVATGTDWTTSSGASLLAVLNAPLSASPEYTRSSYGNTPLQVSLNCNAPAGATISAIQLFASGRTENDNRGTSKIGVSVDYNSKSSAGKSPVLSTTLTYGRDLGVYPKAPDGTLWSSGKLDTTLVSITPDT